MNVTKVISFIIFLIAGVSASAQLQVTDATTPPYNPNNLIRNVFLGSGVEVTSIQLNGNARSVGFFSDGMNTIGLERGIVMSTGNASSVDNENTLTNDNGESTSGTAFQDPDLNALSDQPLADIAMYTIKFIPAADTLRFRYVFASEEYPDFICSINDVFGFFISGPNPAGGTYNADNIALVPDPNDPSGLIFTDVPVSINTVHDGSGLCSDGFAEYYNENPLGTDDLQVNAYLDVFTAEALVIPCQEYTIKLGVADASDDILNTAVFLEAKSFGTGTIEVSVNSLSVDGSLAEGCGSGVLDFTLPQAVGEDFPLDFELLNPPNAATPGIDYPAIDENIFIPAGSNSVSIPLEAFLDNEDEEDEVIQFALQVDLCNRDTFTIILRDDELFKPILPPDVTICDNEEFIIDSELDPAFMLPPPPVFTSDSPVNIAPEQEPVFSDIEVAGVLPTTLTPNLIESVCIVGLEHRDLTDLDIFLISPGGQFLELTTDNGFKPNNINDIDSFKNTCFTPFATENINNGNSLAGPIFADNPTYTGDFAPEGVWSDLWDSQNPTNGTWRLMIIDDFVGIQGTLDEWSITFRSFYNLTYEWSSDQGDVACPTCEDITVNPQVDTEYTLKLIDSYGCSREESINIAVVPSIEKPTASCSNVTQNSIEIEWNDVTDNIGYQVSVNGGPWLSVGTDLDFFIENLLGDTDVTFEVRAIGTACNSKIDTLICTTLPCAAPSITVDASTPTTCPLGDDGTANISASGSFPPFTFTIGGVSNSTGIFSNLPFGNNTVIVEDSDNCSTTLDFIVTGPDEFGFDPDIMLTDPCNVNGEIDATFTITGGTGPYTYNWEGLGTDPVLINITPGDYNLTITDAVGCSKDTFLNVPQLEPLVFDIDITPPLCKDENNGKATLSFTSGLGPFDIQWSNGNNQINSAGWSEGTHSVWVRDILGCLIDTTFEVEPGAILDISLDVNDVSCLGMGDGNAQAMVSGGDGNYIYTWNGGTNNDNITENLGPGMYTLLVEDGNECSADTAFTIEEPDGMTFELAQQNNLCHGTAQGRLNISADSPNGSVDIVWDDGNTSFERIGLVAGEYCFVLRDGTSCERDSCVEITEPDMFFVIETLSGPRCAGGSDGSISVDAFGGNGNYQYNWEGPIDNLPNDAEINDLVAGAYSLTVADSENCQIVYDFDLTESNPIEIDSLVTSVGCFGESTGSISISATGGEGGFEFSWSGPDGFVSDNNSIENLLAGTYILTLTDAGGCIQVTDYLVSQPESGVVSNISEVDTVCFGLTNGKLSISPMGGSAPYNVLWSNGETNNELFGLSPSSYSVTITDSRGCVIEDQALVEERGEIIAEVNQTPSRCFGTADGRAEILSISYGNESASIIEFDFLWNSSPVQTGAKVANLLGGSTYNVIISDKNGCTGVEMVTIESPDPVSAEIVNLDNVKCFGDADGGLEIAGTGGTGDFTFAWDGNTGFQVGSTAIDLAQGTYSVTVTDDNSCTGVVNFAVEQPRPLSMDFRVTDVSCYGELTGRAEAVVQGGVGPYEYLWTNGVREKEIVNAPSEQYNITVTDANECTLTDSTRINEPEGPILVDFTIDDVSCFDGRNGRINIEAMGGSGFFQYSIDGVAFSSSSVLGNLPSGSYDFYVRDVKGCIDTTTSVEISQPEAIVVDLGDDIVIPFGSTTILNPNLFNANGTIRYEWFGSNLELLSCTRCKNPRFEGEREASYELVVYDENGCQGRDFISIRLENYSPLFIPSAFTPNGDEENDVLLVFGKNISFINSFKIYDRWGELVYQREQFEPNDEVIGWDGTFKNEKAPSGMYYWIADVKFANGFEEIYKGTTNLLR